MRTLFAFLLSFAFMASSTAQKDEALLRELTADNQRAIEALALYPPDAQMAILEAAKYPAVLVKMQSMQQKTSAAFRSLLENEPREVQNDLYDLARYPSLIHVLVLGKGNPVGQANALELLPQDQRVARFDLVQRKIKTLTQMDELLQTSNDAFESLVAPYPEPAEAAFRTLLGLPEVIDILNEDLRFTIMVGDLYTDDPAWVLNKMDSLHLAVARNHAKELDDWKNSIENDPQAREEFIDAGRTYAATYYGADSEDYPYQANFETDQVIFDYAYYNPYPYWMGYPWWQPYPRWRPYPYWYDWGYFYQNEVFMVVYMPSWHFMHWYFDHPTHHQHYSHLSARFVNHYYGYRHSGTNISVGVGEWRDRTRTIITDKWLQNDNGRLPERMREYGKFEEERQSHNARNPEMAISESDFIELTGESYPEIRKARQEILAEPTKPQREQPQPADAWMPDKPKREKAPELKQAEPKVTPARPPREAKPEQPAQPQPKRTIEPPAPKKEPVESAPEYHKQKWEAEKQRQDTRPKTEPAPKREPAPASKPEKAPKEPVKTEKKRGN